VAQAVRGGGRGGEHRAGVATAPASSVAVNTQVTADTEVWNDATYLS